jgi:hypothetical protein
VVARCILQFVALLTTLIGVVVLVGVGVVAVAVVDFDPVVVDCTTVGAASYRFHPRRSSFITSVSDTAYYSLFPNLSLSCWWRPRLLTPHYTSCGRD